MYSLLIVDDDLVVRTSLKTLIDWPAAGFRLAGDAVHGRAALEHIQCEPVDVVITDIRMPVMDGLELLRRLGHLDKRPLVLVLSAYTDYPLVRQAFRLGAFDYILKSEINEASLLRAAAILRQVLATGEGALPAPIPGVKRESDWLKDLAAGKSVRSEELTLEDYAIVCLEIENFLQEAARFGENLEESMVQPLLNFALQVPGLSTNCVVAALTPSRYLLTVKPPLGQTLTGDVVVRRGRQVIRAWKTFLNLTASAGVSEPVHGIEFFAAAMEQAERHLSMKYILGAGDTYSVCDRQRFDPLRASACEAEYRSLVYSVRQGDAASELHGRELYERIRRINTTEARDVCMDVLYHLALALESGGDSLLAVLSGENSLHEKLMGLPNSEDLALWLQNTVRAVAHYYGNKRSLSHRSLIDRARDYIVSHYTDPALSVADVAAHVGYNKKYFSTWFGHEMGVPFHEYVTSLRIAHAKELLDRTNIKIYEISEAVGFQSVEYFTRCFKNKEQISPGRYKRQQSN